MVTDDLIIPETPIYKGNPNLKRAWGKTAYTKEQIVEYIKCANDVVYFAQHYIKIVSLDKGLVNIQLYDFQIDILNMIKDNRYTICKLARQSGKSTICALFLIWQALFNDNQTICILANKANTAREILGRVTTMFEGLPKWLQTGVICFNKGSIELENGSRIIASSTTANSIRGLSCNTILVDEAAFIYQFDDFYTSTFPTLSSGKSTKLVLISTPYGLNHFYKIWTDAVNKKNDFVYYEANWRDVPGRDEKWAESQRKMLGDQKFEQEMECSFLGSTNTLISTSVLSNLVWINPLYIENNLYVYENPIEGHVYTLSADCSEGVGNDYSVATVIDVTSIPYKVVAVYKNNEISPILFATVINSIAIKYNRASVLIETNGLGISTATTLHEDLEYENIFLTDSSSGKQELSLVYKHNSKYGVRTSILTKRVGCSILKTLVETNKIILNDFTIISELTTFIVNGNSYAADAGKNDDTVMTLVLFSFLTSQQYFINMTNNIRYNIVQEKADEVMPFGVSTTENIMTPEEWIKNDERYNIRQTMYINGYFNDNVMTSYEEANRFFTDINYTLNSNNEE